MGNDRATTSAKIRAQTVEEVALAILPFQNFVVSAHYNPDADAFGSSLGLAHGLRTLGKSVTVINPDKPKSYYSFLPGIESVVQETSLSSAEVFIACDCGDEKRLGDGAWERIKALPMIVNIDHHSSNTEFGALNFIREGASSTSEMIFDLLEALGSLAGKALITKEVATCLYAGVSADTGSFRYPSTTATTFAVAGRLMSYGADPAAIADALYSQNSVASVMLQGEALSHVHFLKDGAIGVVKVTKEMFDRFEATSDDTEDLADKVRSIQGVKIVAFMREEEGLWKVSLRSRIPLHNVSAIAVSFGGGGHKCAAGFRWKKEVTELERELFPKLEAVLTPR